MAQGPGILSSARCKSGELGRAAPANLQVSLCNMLKRQISALSAWQLNLPGSLKDALAAKHGL